MQLLALPPSDSNFSDPQVLSTFTIYEKNVEKCGEAYLHYRLKRFGLLKEEKEEEEDNSSDETHTFDKEKMKNKRKKKLTGLEGIIERSFYEVLEIADVGFGATKKDISKAHRRMVILYHPDKYHPGEYGEQEKEKWLEIQKAYETLIDPVRRKKYDSLLEFDDSIPKDKEYSKDEFFEVFFPVFRRNAYFSKKDKVPELGGAKTKMGKVFAFYSFWECFSSWRDFKVDDEYDLEQAENRWERRQMEKENKKMKKALMKKEKLRISSLVSRAKKNDPRIVAHQKKEREEREERKKAREETKRLKREAVEKLKRDQREKLEKIKREKEEEIERKKQDKLKILKEKRRKNELVISLFGEKVVIPEYNKHFLTIFLEDVKEEEKDAVIKELQDEKHDASAMERVFREFVVGVELRQQGKKVEKKQKKKTEFQKWSREEIEKLTKGIIKFPAGVHKRWESIALMVGESKSVKEVIKMSKELSIKNMRGTSKIQKTMERVMKAKEKESLNGTSEANLWTQTQQNMLQKAIKKYPSSIPKKERWQKIGSEIEGKTAKECFQRVKEIKARLKSKKAASRK